MPVMALLWFCLLAGGGKGADFVKKKRREKQERMSPRRATWSLMKDLKCLVSSGRNSLSMAQHKSHIQYSNNKRKESISHGFLAHAHTIGNINCVKKCMSLES